MMKKHVFITEHLLLWGYNGGIGDEQIFIARASQIVKCDKICNFRDIDEMSHKAICVVVTLELCFLSYKPIIIFRRHILHKNCCALVLIIFKWIYYFYNLNIFYLIHKKILVGVGRNIFLWTGG